VRLSIVLCAVAALLCSGAACAEDKPIDKATGQDVVEWCSDHNDTPLRQRCWALLGLQLWVLSQANAQEQTTGVKYCTPSKNMLETAQDDVTAWLKKHPEANSRPASDAISDATMALYKCH